MFKLRALFPNRADLIIFGPSDMISVALESHSLHLPLPPTTSVGDAKGLSIVLRWTTELRRHISRVTAMIIMSAIISVSSWVAKRYEALSDSQSKIASFNINVPDFSDFLKAKGPELC